MWPVVTPAVRDSHYQLYIPDPWGQWGEKVEKSGKQARGESSKSKSKKKMKEKNEGEAKQSKAKQKQKQKQGKK
jgi:hypothetical protein